MQGLGYEFIHLRRRATQQSFQHKDACPSFIFYLIYAKALIRCIKYIITSSSILAISTIFSSGHEASIRLTALCYSFAIFFYDRFMNLFLMIGGSAAHSILEVGIWVKELGNVELQVSLYRLIIACFFSIYQRIDCAIFSIIMSLGSNFVGLMGFGVFLIILSCSYCWIFDQYIYQYAMGNFSSQQHSSPHEYNGKGYSSDIDKSLLAFLVSLFYCYSISSYNYQL